MPINPIFMEDFLIKSKTDLGDRTLGLLVKLLTCPPCVHNRRVFLQELEETSTAEKDLSPISNPLTSKELDELVGGGIVSFCKKKQNFTNLCVLTHSDRGLQELFGRLFSTPEQKRAECWKPWLFYEDLHKQVKKDYNKPTS